MKSGKPDRGISKMEVLKDIRELLSVTQGREGSGEAQSRDEGHSKTEIARLEEQVQNQQDEILRLESEKKELAAKVELLGDNKGKPMTPGSEELAEEVVQLEAQKEELSSALSQIDGLLQLKAKDLLKRIARFYEEAGQNEIAIEFRRAGDELENMESYAYFLRALLDQ